MRISGPLVERLASSSVDQRDLCRDGPDLVGTRDALAVGSSWSSRWTTTWRRAGRRHRPGLQSVRGKAASNIQPSSLGSSTRRDGLDIRALGAGLDGAAVLSLSEPSEQSCAAVRLQRDRDPAVDRPGDGTLHLASASTPLRARPATGPSCSCSTAPAPAVSSGHTCRPPRRCATRRPVTASCRPVRWPAAGPATSASPGSFSSGFSCWIQWPQSRLTTSTLGTNPAHRA